MISTTRLAARLHLALSRTYSSTSASTSAVPAEAKPVPSLVPQSPNRAATWSTEQRPRPAGQSGPRFEQTTMELQPNPLSAMELIANEPIRLVESRKAVCDGGTFDLLDPSLFFPNRFCFVLFSGIGPLGHPKIYINLVRTI
jgi:NADH dehydrogenase (ubiquinone) Fe-S protein 6